MGTWGIGAFENDAAVDWSYGLETTSGMGYVEAAFAKVLAHAEGIEIPAPDAECAVAAAYVLARLNGWAGEPTAYTETVDEWVARNGQKVPEPTIALAMEALDRIGKAPSELLDLWEESGEEEGWLEDLSELKRRMTGSDGGHEGNGEQG